MSRFWKCTSKLSFDIFVFLSILTFIITFLKRHSSVFICWGPSLCSSLHVCSVGKTSLGCRAEVWTLACTVRKMDLILRSTEWRPQMQFSMARRFMLQLLRRNNVKFCKMLNFTLCAPWLGNLKNTGGRRTSILQICSPRLFHWATGTHTKRAKFYINIHIFCHI